MKSFEQSFTCSFIGLGLIGGSIARAIKETYGSTSTIYAYDIDSTSLHSAVESHTIDKSVDSISSLPIWESNLIFLCAPVYDNVHNLGYLTNLREDCIITDVGSVKGNIMDEVIQCHLEKYYIGGHPMTGSERNGFLASSSRILENAYYVLTPSKSVSDSKIKFMYQLVENLKAIPIVTDSSTHDIVTAAISHLPHIISAQLVNLVSRNDAADHLMKRLAAGGFKDITRISSSSPIMWEQICFMNQDNIISFLEQYIDSLKEFTEDLKEQKHDKVKATFADAKEYRNSFQDISSGPIKQIFRIYVDVPDEPGIIANIASLLANKQINITNIGIIHNREFESGALRIELPDNMSLQNAIHELTDKSYKISI